MNANSVRRRWLLRVPGWFRRPRPSLFIGRRELLADVGERAAAGEFFAVTGHAGVGKSAFVSRLIETLRRDGHYVVEARLQTFRLEGFDQFCALLLHVHDQLVAGADSKLPERVRQALIKPAPVARSEETGDETDHERAERSRALARQDLVREFTAEIAALAGSRIRRLARRGRRLYVVLDEFNSVTDPVVTDWLIRLARSRPETVTVLVGRNDMAVPAGAIRRTLANFSREECADYLRQSAGRESVEALVEPAFRLTDGTPQAVAIVGRLVAEQGPAAAGRRLSEWLTERAGLTYEARLMDLVRELLSTGTEPIPPEVMDVLVVVRRFDRRLLDALRDGSVGAEPMSDLYDKIRRLPFVEPNARSGQHEWLWHSSLEVDYRVHNLVRSVLSRELATRDPDRFTALHARALAYYNTEINKRRSDLNQRDPFLDAVRYKDDRWRYLYGEWLYHLGHTTGPERAAARLTLAQVYFDAFWWWDYYSSRFRFCADLLAEWFAVCQDAEDRRLHDELLRFKLNFPVGYGTREPFDPRWLDVRASLHQVRRMGALAAVAVPVNPDHRQLRALTSLFLAEAAQSYDGDFGMAERYYADAQALFDDDMGRDWTRHQRAEMWVGTAREHLTPELLEGVEERARHRGDHELLARLAMFTADCRLAEGRFEAAATQVVVAVLHAFVFHVRQTSAPDDYSASFHEEAVAKAAEVINAIHEQSAPSQWLAVTDQVGALLAPLTAYHAARGGRTSRPSTRGGRPVDVIDLLPPPPAAADLHDDSRPYVDAAIWAREFLIGPLEMSVSP